MAEAQPSGVRLVFRTRATAVELDALPTKRPTRVPRPAPTACTTCSSTAGSPGRPVATGGNVLTIDMTTGAAETRARSGRHRPVHRSRRAATKDVEIWLPHNEITELVALRTDAPVEPCPEPGRRVWLHHGSSISHGSDAASPTTTWPALRRRPRRRRADQPGPGRQRPARPVHRPRPARHPGRPDQRQDRHQPGQPRPDAPARLRPGRARLPRHHPRGAPRRHRCWSSRRSCARSTRTPPAPAPRTSSGLGEGKLQLPGHGRPGGPASGS